MSQAAGPAMVIRRRHHHHHPENSVTVLPYSNQMRWPGPQSTSMMPLVQPAFNSWDSDSLMQIQTIQISRLTACTHELQNQVPNKSGFAGYPHSDDLRGNRTKILHMVGF